MTDHLTKQDTTNSQSANQMCEYKRTIYVLYCSVLRLLRIWLASYQQCSNAIL